MKSSTPATIVSSIFVLTAIVPILVLAKTNNLIIGFTLAFVLQLGLLSLYLKWLNKNPDYTSPKFLDVYPVLLFCIVLNGVGVGYVKASKGESWILHGMIGAVLTLLTQALTIRITNRL